MTKNEDDIKLKFSENLIFPDVCVHCGSPDPDTTIPLSPKEEENGLDERMIVYAVPACSSCVFAQLGRERQIANLAFTGFLVIFTGVASYFLKNYYLLLYIAIAFFIIVLFASIKVLKGVKTALSIKSLNESTITFQFNNKKYKDSFLELNKSLIIDEPMGVEN